MSQEPRSPSVQIDDIDLKIIGALQVDGRRPVASIARELGAPKSTVQRRLDALVRNGVIMIAAYADSSKLGLSFHVHLNLRLDLALFQQAIDEVIALTEVRWVAVTTGPADVVAEAYFASSDHLHQFIRDKLSSIEGIASVETSVILSVVKLTFHWDELLHEAGHHVSPHVRLGTPETAFHDSNTEGETRCRSPSDGAPSGDGSAGDRIGKEGNPNERQV